MMSTKLNLAFIVFMCLIVVSLWFSNGLMFGGGEEGLPFYNLTQHLRSMSYVWNEAQAGFDMVIFLPRVPYFWMLEKLFVWGVNTIYLQAVTFFITISVGCIAVYFLVKETIGGNLRSLIASIFYFLNPYSMIQIWGRGIYAQFFAFALIPSFLLFYICGLKRRNPIYLILAILISIIFSPAFVFPTQILVLWIPILIYFVFHVWVHRNNKSEVLFAFGSSLFLGICWLLAHSWWLWPYVKTLGASVSKLGDIEYNIGSLRGISLESSFGVVIRLIHKFLLTGLYGETYSSYVFKTISWLMPIVLLFSLNVFRKLKHFGFYVSLLLTSLFIVMGTNSPLGFVFEWLFRNVSPFQGFRNPYEKAGMLLMLAYVPFFAIGVNKLPKLLTWCVIILTCGLYVWPMWTGQFAGGVKISPWFRVPSYYKEADNWISAQNKNLRIIQLPLNPGDGVIYTWEHPFRGLESGEFLFSNPSIGRNFGLNKNYYNILLERFGSLQKDVFGPDPDLTGSKFRSQYLYQELGKLNIKYIILHRDVDEKLSGMKSAQETFEFLAVQKNIKKVKSFGLLDIYEVDLPDEIAHVYSPNVKISYERVNPTLYKFYVQNTKMLIDIHFLERYDPGWEMTIDNKKIDTHSTIFSYANSWSVDRIGSYNGYIKFKPQDFVYEGAKISIITTCGLLMGLIIIGFTRLYARYK